MRTRVRPGLKKGLLETVSGRLPLLLCIGLLAVLIVPAEVLAADSSRMPRITASFWFISVFQELQRDSAAGTGLFLSQVPEAYWKKSSQGLTDLSRLAGSRPTPGRLGAAAATGAGVAAGAVVAAAVVGAWELVAQAVSKPATAPAVSNRYLPLVM